LYLAICHFASTILEEERMEEKLQIITYLFFLDEGAGDLVQIG
jgi:hypothetical protein